MWVEDPRVENIINDSWSLSRPNVGDKIKNCTEALEDWGRNVFGAVKKEVIRCTRRLRDISVAGGSVEEICKSETELNVWLDREELYWWQRSRVLWLQSGDRNTSFFHEKANQRKRRNCIQRLKLENGDCVETQEDISRVVHDYFSSLFYSELTDNFPTDFPIQAKVTSDMNLFLTAEFVREEIDMALKSMHPTKAPGPDGLPALFYQRYWPIIGEDIKTEVLQVLNSGADIAKWNKTNVVLIPKCKNPDSVRDFRPISLCNVLYKIISKVITNRLKHVLPFIISEEQSAFVKGRQISDNILLSFECFHSLRNRKKGRNGGMALKLDVSKAYDRVEWNYLEFIMEKMGFCDQWRNLVMRCVRTVTFSILVNGEPTDIITPMRGIRQGDPLSPFLFFLCAEGFSALLKNAENNRLLTGFKPCPRSPTISHLLFANDSLILSKASIEQARVIKRILDDYERLSRQKINMEKSLISFSPCVREEVKAVINLSGLGRSFNYHQMILS